jgi:hypothetical protein
VFNAADVPFLTECPHVNISTIEIGEIVQPFAIAAVGAHYHMVDTGNLRASPPTFFK